MRFGGQVEGLPGLGRGNQREGLLVVVVEADKLFAPLGLVESLLDGCQQLASTIDADVRQRPAGVAEGGRVEIAEAGIVSGLVVVDRLDQERIEALAQEPGVLPRDDLARIGLQQAGQLDVFGQPVASRLQPGQDGADVGVVGRLGRVPLVEPLVAVAGHHVVEGRLVIALAVIHRPHDCEFLGMSGQQRQVVTNLDTRHVGRDRQERPADLDRSLGLQVKRVLVGRGAPEVHQDAPLGASESGRWTRRVDPVLQGQHFRQPQSQRSQRPDPQEFTARMPW